MLRKTFTILIAVFLLLATLPAATAEPAGQAEPTISASSAILVDGNSGQILFEKNAHERRAIASTTKIMTAIIALERTKLSETVTIRKTASEVGESELFLKAGEKMSVQSLLYALLLQSANDAAAALAEHIGGSIPGFAEFMNRKALSLGAKDTHFVNPHGLYKVDHYSTAYDLALIARYALGDPTFAKIVATKEYTVPRPFKNLPGPIKNHNKLLWQYPYATGVKTGFIRQSGHCLVSSASKNGVQLIAAVLNSPNSDACFVDSRTLLEYGFNEFRLDKVIKKNRVYKKVQLPELFDQQLELVASKDLLVPVRKVPGSLKKNIIAKESKSLPVKKGQKLGQIEVAQFGRSLGKIDLVAAKTIEKPGRIQWILLWFKFIFSKAKRR